MATVKAILLLPVKDNDGRGLAAEIQEVRTRLWVAFAAYTDEGVVEGIFRMTDGSPALDNSRKITLFLDESAIAELEAILLDFKRQTIQEKMYLEIQHAVELRLI